MAAGKHVLYEKPFTSKAANAEGVVIYLSDDRGQTIERVFEGAVRGVFIDPDDARRIVIGLNGRDRRVDRWRPEVP